MKMFFETLIFIMVVILLLFLFFRLAQPLSAPSEPIISGSLVCFQENCFSAELAKTQAQIERGLMFRKSLDKGSGMLFIFQKEGVYPFWMKNTYIPLDIVWIGGDSRVVYIDKNAQPCKGLICPIMAPSGSAKYVLELNAGTCENIGLEKGDQLKIIIK